MNADDFYVLAVGVVAFCLFGAVGFVMEVLGD